MTLCSQTNIPEINQEVDPCDGSHKSTECIIHPAALVYLGITADSTLYDILIAMNASLIDKENRIQALEAIHSITTTTTTVAP